MQRRGRRADEKTEIFHIGGLRGRQGQVMLLQLDVRNHWG